MKEITKAESTLLGTDDMEVNQKWFTDKVATEITSFLQANPIPIKELVWKERDFYSAFAHGLNLGYEIASNLGRTSFRTNIGLSRIGEYPTLEAAKAAAQEHYNKIIREALG